MGRWPVTPVVERRDRAVGTALALFSVSVWAGWLPITRLGVLSQLNPFDVAAVRFATAGLLLLPVLVRRWREVPWRRPLVIIGLLIGAGVPYLVIFATGLRLANSGQGAVLGPGSVSTFATLIAWLTLKERPSVAQLTGLGVTLAGALTVVAHDLWVGGGRLVGFAFIMTGALCWATFTVASRFARMSPVVNAAVVSVVNAALFLPVYLSFGGAEHLRAAQTNTLVLQILYQGALTGVVALIAFSAAIQRLGAAAAARYMPLVPVLAACFGWFLLGDKIDPATFLGLIAVATGVLIASNLINVRWLRQ